MIMAVRVAASQRFGPLRLRRSRTGAVQLILRLGPISWTWPLRTPRRLSAAERRQAQTRAAQRAAGRRLLLAELAVAGLIVAALAGAVALIAGAGWARRRHTLPTTTEED